MRGKIRCRICGKWKDLDEFKKHNKSQTGYAYICRDKACRDQASRDILRQIIYLKDQQYTVYMISSMVGISEGEVRRRLKEIHSAGKE